MVLSLLCCFKIIETSHNYQVQNGVNINPNVDTSLILSSMRTENHIFCLAVCNSNQECLTTVYIESEENNNCFSYKKHFSSTETTTSSNTKLSKKYSKFHDNNNNGLSSVFPPT